MKARASFLSLIAFVLGSFAYAADISPVLELEFPGWDLVNPNTSTVEIVSADLEAMDSDLLTKGALSYLDRFEADGFEHRYLAMTVSFVVPNKLPGFQTIAEAATADVRIRLNHDGEDYAECTFAPRKFLSRSIIYFDVELEIVNGQVTEYKGFCDIDLVTDGVQSGFPRVAEGVYAHAMVMDDGRAFEFVDGMCQCDYP